VGFCLARHDPAHFAHQSGEKAGRIENVLTLKQNNLDAYALARSHLVGAKLYEKGGKVIAC